MPPIAFSSESVTEGHPDKVADAISDAVLDAALVLDKDAKVACETLVTTNLTVIAGEISAKGLPDIEAVARETIRRIGYTDPSDRFDADSCEILVRLDPQSTDIRRGLERSAEARADRNATDELDVQGAGDQGMMYGFACDETSTLMPLGPHLAHRLAEALTAARREGKISSIKPDGKTQVTVEYGSNGEPVRIRSILISTHHHPDVDVAGELRPQLWDKVVLPTVPGQLLQDTVFYVNPTGSFVHGGPAADAGLTGRKIIVDTYGGISRHGGGAFSGKDSSKVDRSAAYAARWVAKNVVASGAARRCEIQVAYAIGMAQPLSLMVETFGTATVNPDKIEKAVRHLFDLRPAAIVRDLALKNPIYTPTSAYGHFGRELPSFTWENTAKAAQLKELLNL